MDLSTKLGKEIPSRNLREKRPDYVCEFSFCGEVGVRGSNLVTCWSSVYAMWGLFMQVRMLFRNRLHGFLAWIFGLVFVLEGSGILFAKNVTQRRVG